MKPIRIFFGIIKVPLDFGLTVAAFFVALKFRTLPSFLSYQSPFDFTTLPTHEDFFTFTLKCALLLVVIFAINQMYLLKVSRALARDLAKMFFLIFAWIMVIIAYFFAIRTFPFSRLLLMYATILTTIFLGAERIIIHLIRQQLLKKGMGQYRVAIIGENDFARDFMNKIKNHIDYKLIGFIGETSKHEQKDHFLGTTASLEKLIKKHKIEQIIQTGEVSKFGSEVLATCRELHVKYSFVPDLMEVQRTNVEISTMRGIPILELKPTPLDGWGNIVKRSFDIIGSLLGLIVGLPFLLLIALAIKIDSRGPVFFTKLDDGQPVVRVGQHGRVFKFYKFRTMHPNTHNQRYTTLADKNLRKNSPLVKIENDPRITRVGKFLRRFSIDELPQLWNIFAGDMSIVGPRPHFPEEVEKYSRGDKFVLEVKPGLTGMAQISGRSDLDFREEVRLDTFYIQNWSMDLDLKVILKTFFIVLRGYKE
ncbi:MAG: sugar transferase [Candidatus Gracilibacteria bacterium]